MGHQKVLKKHFHIFTKMPTVWPVKLFHSATWRGSSGDQPCSSIWGEKLKQNWGEGEPLTKCSGAAKPGGWLQATSTSATNIHFWASWAAPLAITEITLQMLPQPPPSFLPSTNGNKTGIFFPYAGTYGRSLHCKQCCILGKQNIFLLKRCQIALSKALLFAFLWQY